MAEAAARFFFAVKLFLSIIYYSRVFGYVLCLTCADSVRLLPFFFVSVVGLAEFSRLALF
jgi:hypothetical protein